MKRVIQCAASLVIVLIVIHHSLNAQSAASRGTGCKECHECEIPTKLNPCLKVCPRGHMITVHNSADAGPVDITLNRVEGGPDVYEPVKFAHRAHAKMADMSGGCAQCHHYNLTGAVLACRTCHAVGAQSKNADLSKPGLKGAYHRQCVNCHRESGVDTKCDGLCHHAKSSTRLNRPAITEAKENVKVVRPDRLVYETSNVNAKTVTFFHNDHADRFGLACSSCHANEPCSKCHKPGGAAAKPIEHLRGGHDRCSACHSVTENCGTCHDKQPIARFDHARKTRFDLGRFHSALACTRCHKEQGKYKNLSVTCTACHAGWKPGSFDHAFTGIKLSEAHASLDCETCHLESNFAQKPACNACHDDKSYPAALPGVRAQRVKAVKK
ncbi:MAG: cytochrome c3 family protein [Ignavibacteriales bacterium]|nr:cytochrome c3 family protein [Ignavibacteriales bacterium]